MTGWLSLHGLDKATSLSTHPNVGMICQMVLSLLFVFACAFVMPMHTPTNSQPYTSFNGVSIPCDGLLFPTTTYISSFYLPKTLLDLIK